MFHQQQKSLRLLFFLNCLIKRPIHQQTLNRVVKEATGLIRENKFTPLKDGSIIINFQDSKKQWIISLHFLRACCQILFQPVTKCTTSLLITSSLFFCRFVENQNYVINTSRLVVARDGTSQQRDARSERSPTSQWRSVTRRRTTLTAPPRRRLRRRPPLLKKGALLITLICDIITASRCRNHDGRRRAPSRWAHSRRPSTSNHKIRLFGVRRKLNKFDVPDRYLYFKILYTIQMFLSWTFVIRNSRTF